MVMISYSCLMALVFSSDEMLLSFKVRDETLGDFILRDSIFSHHVRPDFSVNVIFFLENKKRLQQFIKMCRINKM